MIQDIAGERVPYIFFFAVVALAGVYGGLWPGLFATMVGALSGYFFIVKPYTTGSEIADIFVLSQFFFVGIIISIICEALHRSMQKIELDAALVREKSIESMALAEALTKSALARTEAEERFRIAQEVSPVGFTFLDAVRDEVGKITDFKWSYINPAAYSILPKGADLGKYVRAVYHVSKNLDDILEHFAAVISSGQAWQQRPVLWQMPEFDGWLDVRAVRVGDGVAVSFFDVTKLVQLQAELELKIAELDRRDRQKDEFLAVLAHELRNPLAPLKNALQILRLAGGRKEVAEKALDMMERQIDQLVRLVDDLLDVSRITHGKIVLDKHRVELKEILNAAIETALPGIQSAHHQLEINLPPEPIFIDGDKARLTQIFGNIINNATKYTPENGKITISATVQGDAATVTVTDTGVGVSPELMPIIFDMFVQVNDSKSRSQGGMGVGLALVHKLVALHGGSVSVQSEGVGKGSTFTVTLPVAKRETDMPSREALPDPSSYTKRRVVIVDDNKDSAQSLGTIMELSGAEIHLAYSGAEGLALIEDIKPDIAILDIGMPGMSGHELARRIRAEDWGRNMKIIALSGWGQEGDKKLSKAAGFDHHLVKPVGTEDIAHILTNYNFPPEGARIH